MFRNLFFYFLFLFISSHLSGQKALWGVEMGVVATKPSSTGSYGSNINQHFETGLGPSLNLNYTWKFKKALWVKAGFTAKSLTYKGIIGKLIFGSNLINNTDGVVFLRRMKHLSGGAELLTGVQLPGVLQRFSPFVGFGGSVILDSRSKTKNRSGGYESITLSHGHYDGTITEYIGGLQYSQPIGARFFLTTSVRYVYAPTDIVDISPIFSNPTYNLSHFAAYISLQRAIR